MTREDQLVYCKTCLNRKMDLQEGLLCSLSGAKANFESDCPDYAKDETVKDYSNYETIENQGDEKGIRVSPEVLEKLRLEQNLASGVIAGIAAGLVGAILWGMITVVTNYQIGYVAIAILSCFLGNFLGIMGYLANDEGLAYIEILLLFDYNYFIPVMTETFSFMDVVFYGIAGYEGFKFSFRVITEEDVRMLK
ncbi:MAG: hypothetical protein OCD76_12765 [Reichenbachiella sp.]